MLHKLMQPMLTPSSALIFSKGENCWLMEAVREQRRQPKRARLDRTR